MRGLLLSAGKDDAGQIGISFVPVISISFGPVIGISFGPVIGSVAGSMIPVFVLEKFHPGSVTGSV